MAEVRKTAAEIRAAGDGRVDWAKVDATTDADIARHAIEDGEDPGSLPPDWWPSAAAVRERLGLTQPGVADLLAIPVGTWRNWEQGRTTPDPAVRTLMRIMWHEPEAATRALRLQSSGVGAAAARRFQAENAEALDALDDGRIRENETSNGAHRARLERQQAEHAATIVKAAQAPTRCG